MLRVLIRLTNHYGSFNVNNNLCGYSWSIPADGPRQHLNMPSSPFLPALPASSQQGDFPKNVISP